MIFLIFHVIRVNGLIDFLIEFGSYDQETGKMVFNVTYDKPAIAEELKLDFIVDNNGNIEYV